MKKLLRLEEELKEKKTNHSEESHKKEINYSNHILEVSCIINLLIRH